MEKIKNIADFFRMYVEGFKKMTKLGKMLWALILIKLFIMFAILKVFLFPNFLNSKFDNEQDKADYVAEQLVNND
ncbi:MAG: DUF4492 domain-containing protein [Prevotellaceae bacterium]|jgi:hypothetical protein|nr:DUF4492 domain-containing protein [Prevotellaceae bacterium]